MDALKPVRNLKVTFRGKSYTIKDGVSTVAELKERFQEVSGLTSDELDAGIVWKGRILRDRGEELSSIGVRNGDRVMILPVATHAKGLDLLGFAIFVATQNEESLEKVLKKGAENVEEIQEMWNDLSDKVRTLNRKDVADTLRNGFDLGYHQLRAWWESPLLRQGLHNPILIESYRQVVSTNFPPKLLAKTPSRLQKAVQSAEVWLKEFQKLTSAAIRLGDTIMDGVLDLLLDVLKQSNSASMYSSQTMGDQQDSDAFRAGDPDGSSGTTSDPRMDDPSIANNLLYELSESEDE